MKFGKNINQKAVCVPSPWLGLSGVAWAVGVLGLFLVLCAGPIHAATQPADRLNVILIMADDIGYEAFGCYGSEDCKTPRLDALAANGIRFNHCYAQPLCTPSRVKIMTGQSNLRNYTGFRVLAPDQQTFGHVFQQAGYNTAIVGKWQLWDSVNVSEDQKKGMHPSKAGFDSYCLWQVGKLGSRYWSPLIETNGELKKHGKDVFGPDVFVRYIEQFVSANKDEPFFVYYPMALPHDPFVRTPASPDRSGQDTKMQKHVDMVEYVDLLMGRLVDHLEKEGVLDNTLILFTGDNGTNKAITSRANGQVIQGGKSLMTDAGTRVPLIVSWPAGMPASVRGSVSDDLVDFSDLLPTMAEAAGIELPATHEVDGKEIACVYDGVTFLPQLQGKEGTPREAIFMYFNRHAKGAGNRFARDQRWKLYGKGSQAGELYDIARDVLEQSPIAPGSASPEAEMARQKLQAVLDAMRVSTD